MSFMASRICCSVGASFDLVLVINFCSDYDSRAYFSLRATDLSSSVASRGVDCRAVSAPEGCLGSLSCATKRPSLGPPRTRLHIPSSVSRDFLS